MAHEALSANRPRLEFVLGGERFVARLENGGVRVRRAAPDGTLEAWPSTTAYWFAWLNFHPRSALVR